MPKVTKKPQSRKRLRLQEGVDYLNSHPDMLKLSPRDLATKVSEPNFTKHSWQKIKELVGYHHRSFTEIATEYLAAHPELHHLSGRAIADLHPEMGYNQSVWNRARRALNIPPLPKFNGVQRKYNPRKKFAVDKVTETRTYIFDHKNNEVRIKTTSAPEEVHTQLHAETVEFLAWLLKKKEYQRRHNAEGIVYSKTERIKA